MEDLQSEANRNIREMLVTKIIKGNPDLGMQQLLEIFRDSECMFILCIICLNHISNNEPAERPCNVEHGEFVMNNDPIPTI
jgi:hypothetical protein